MAGKWNNWIEHPDHPLDDWRYEVASDYTRLSYGEWVEQQAEAESE